VLDALIAGGGLMPERISGDLPDQADVIVVGAGAAGNRSKSMIINRSLLSYSGDVGPGPILFRSMVGKTTPDSGLMPEVWRAGRDERIVWAAMWTGLILAVLGLADGLAKALETHVTSCPDGTSFPQGTTNFNCYAHPNAGSGIAIAVISALLGILVVLAAISAAASLRSASAARRAVPDQQATS